MENQTYKNPIISGYNPDPSICRVEEDYYIVNSSFEYFPGVPVYHSKNSFPWKNAVLPEAFMHLPCGIMTDGFL